MSHPISIKKFADKQYRDAFLRTQIGGGISYQIQALRQKFGLTQKEFAERTGKTQTVISRLENSGSGMVNVQTLLDIAEGCDVALVVKFVSYPEFLRQTTDMSPAELQPETVDESLDRIERAAEAAAQAIILKATTNRIPATSTTNEDDAAFQLQIRKGVGTGSGAYATTVQ